jgi:RNA polymerase primary sigma factor
LLEEIEEMAHSEEHTHRNARMPENMIEAINKLVRTSRQMFSEIGREPTPEELAERLTIPLEKVCRLLETARRPISLHTGGSE